MTHNLLANLLGKGWTALMALLCTPFYVHQLGIEGYGLIGFFNSLVIFSFLLDLGLSGVLNREFARLSIDESNQEEMRNLLRTLEVICWGIALVIGVCVVSASSWMARHWFQTEEFSASRLEGVLVLMGLALAFQWPFSLYSSGLLGLQKQIRLNGAIIVIATLRYAGPLLVFCWFSATVETFFYWQLGVSFLQTVVVRYALWSLFKGSAYFDGGLLKRIWRFALGMGGISATGMILNQLDKVILSKMLSLKMFGYYSLAWMCANGLYCFFAPLFTAYFPRFSQLVALGDEARLKAVYHKACQMMSVILLPIACALALFSREILFWWAGDMEAAPLVSLLILGTTLHGLMQMPFALQFAYGWTKLTFYQNLCGLLLFVPLMVWGVRAYGARGGTFAWILLNFFYIFVGVHLMHRKVLLGEKWRWCFQDIVFPLCGVLVVMGTGRLLFNPSPGLLLCLTFIAMLAALLSTPLRFWWSRSERLEMS